MSKKRYNCKNRMCGALDCKTCYPFQDEAYRKWFMRNFRKDEDLEREDDEELRKELEADREKD